jgi:hypothetical protein
VVDVLRPSETWILPLSIPLFSLVFLPLLLVICIVFTMPNGINGISKRQQQRNEKALTELIRTVPGNDRCADCDALTPGSSPALPLLITR